MKYKIFIISLFLLFFISCTINLYTGREINSLLKEINYVDINYGYPLHKAVELGSLKLIEFLINEGADIDKKDQNGQTPLHIAVKLLENSSNYKNYLEVVEYLIQNGANVNAIDKEGNTPLLLALKVLKKRILYKNEKYPGWVLQKAYPKLKRLLKHGANPNIKNNRDDLPIFVALSIKGKNFSRERNKIVRLLIKYGADPNKTDVNGQTIYHILVKYEEEELIKELLEEYSLKSPLYIKDKNGDLPLHLAARLKNPTIYKLLTKYYSDNQKLSLNKDLELPLYQRYLLSKNQVKEIYNWIISFDSPSRPTFLSNIPNLDYLITHLHFPGKGNLIHIAAMGDEIDFMRFLIKKGMKVNSQTDSGFTALHYAAKMTNPQMVRLLVEKGAEVNVKEKINEMTPFIIAAGEYKNITRHEEIKEIFNILASHGANIRARDRDGLTALHYLVFGNKSVNSIMYELYKKKDPKVYDFFYQNVKEIIEFLISHGLDINVKTKEGLTPLHYAVGENNFYMVQALLELGADPNLRSDDKVFPIYLVFHEERKDSIQEDIKLEIIKQLVKHGSVIPHGKWIVRGNTIEKAYLRSILEIAERKRYKRIHEYLKNIVMKNK